MRRRAGDVGCAIQTSAVDITGTLFILAVAGDHTANLASRPPRGVNIVIERALTIWHRGNVCVRANVCSFVRACECVFVCVGVCANAHSCERA